MFVQMLYNFMMLVVTSSMFTIMVVMVLVAACLMFFHVVHMVFVLMGMLVSGRMNVLVMFWMMVFHVDLTFCDGFCRRVS